MRARQRDRHARKRRRGAPRRRRKLWVTLAVWALLLPALASVLGVVTHARFDILAPTPAGWLADLAATLSAQAMAAGAASVLLAIATRRAVAGLLGLASLLVLLVSMLGVERAPPSREPEGPVVGVLAMNAWSSGVRGDEQLEVMLASGADLIMLNEVSGSLLAAMRSDPRVREAYPHFRLPDRAGPGFRFVMSRHPLRRGVDAFGFAWPEIEAALGFHAQRVVRVDLPAGPIVFAGVQFRSPRSPERWASGNAQAADTARGLAMIAEVTRLPIIAAGDLNAAPTSVRARRFAEVTGLVWAKPALRVGGTYPASMPGLGQVPIDGGLVSPGVRVVSYQAIEMPGSDHDAALMVLELPGGRADQRTDQRANQADDGGASGR